MAETPDSRSARLLASLYSPPDERAVIDALLGIERELATSVEAGVDHSVAHARLQWWRDECERAGEGHGVHPLTQTLARAFATRGHGSAAPGPAASAPVLAGLAGFVDTAVWDLASATFDTRRELTAYCERWSNAMFLTAASHAAAGTSATNTSPGTGSAWPALGAAIREIEMLSDLATEANAGRVRIPLDELEARGLDAEALAKTPWPAGLASLLAARHEALRAQLAISVAAISATAQPFVRGLLAWSALAWRQSKRAQTALPNRLRVERFDGLADAWTAWRAARRATKRRFTLP
jgi:15-cis-phytoene synthase